VVGILATRRNRRSEAAFQQFSKPAAHARLGVCTPSLSEKTMVDEMVGFDGGRPSRC
jgi:hypothetical protein